MKFTVRDNVHPSQEFLMTILNVLFWAPILIMFASWTLGSIKDWITRMMSKKKSVSDQLREMSSVTFNVLDYDGEPVIDKNDFPRADWTDAKNGKHWEVNNDVLKEPENKLGDTFLIYQVDYVVSMISKIDGLLTFLSGLRDFKSAAVDIDKYLRGHFKQEELILEDGPWGGLVFKNAKLTRVKWPNAEQFKNPVTSVQKIKSAGNNIGKKLSTLADKFDALMSTYDPKTEDKSVALGVAAYIRTCSEVVGYVGALKDLEDGCFPQINNDVVEGCALTLLDKDGKDITDYH